MVVTRGKADRVGAVTFPAAACVLVVEDDSINRQVCVAMLDQMGIRFDWAENGEDALLLLQRNRYDLVLMDCEMPFMDGYAATQEWRRLERERTSCLPLPIVALTSHSEAEDRQVCLAAGMDDHLSKPITFQTLQRKLVQWLGLPLAGVVSEVVANSQASDPDQALDQRRLHELRESLKGTPGGFVHLVERFLQRAESDLLEISQALSAAELDQVLHRTHTLKSQSAIFGAMALSGLLKQLELQARSRVLSAAIEGMKQVQKEFARVKMALELLLRGE
ncbi:MAG: response regulator [Magnetococcales bacterium]|nr:response regulator [Magnetococcales bacterium]